MSPIFAVAIGGAFGGVCRFLVGQALPAAFERFPLGTLSVNILGCFYWSRPRCAARCRPQPNSKGGDCDRFLGRFLRPFRASVSMRWRCSKMGAMNAATYLLASNLVGLAAVCFGIWGARMVLGPELSARCDAHGFHS